MPIRHCTEMDAGLAVMSRVTHEHLQPGSRWTQTELAEICGCDQSYIAHIEQRALQKVFRRFRQTLEVSEQELRHLLLYNRS